MIMKKKTYTQTGMRVSTVKLPYVAHNGEFETMVFKGESYDEVYVRRYRTWDAALADHDRVVEMHGGAA